MVTLVLIACIVLRLQHRLHFMSDSGAVDEPRLHAQAVDSQPGSTSAVGSEKVS